MVDNDHNNAMVIILSSPSGGGKSSIATKLIELDKNIILSISTTTRTPRPGETHGVDYFFSSKEEFDSMQKNGDFIEHTQIYGNYYGTPKEFIYQQLAEGRDVLFDVNSHGAYKLMESMPNKTMGIFIMPPDLDTLKERLTKRNQDDNVAIEKRLSLAEIEMNEAKNYDHIVINDNLDRAVQEILHIINSQRQT